MKAEGNTLILVQEGGDAKMREAKEMDKRKAAGSTYIDMLCSSQELNQSSVRWV